MIAFGLILASTTRRLLRFRRLIGLVLLTGLPAPVLFFVSFGAEDSRLAGLYDEMMLTVFMVLALPVTALVICSAALGEERRLRTMPFLVLKPVSRWTIAGAVTASAIVATIVVGGIGVALTWVVGAILTGNTLIGLPALVALAISSAGYAAIYVPLGLLVSRSTLAGLAYIFIWEFIITSIASGVSASSIWRIGASAYGDVRTLSRDGAEILDEMLSTVSVGIGGASAKVIVMLVISIAFTGLLLRRRDLANE